MLDCSGSSSVSNTSTEALELLSLFQQAERKLSGGNFDTEKAIMREMCTMAWRTLEKK